MQLGEEKYTFQKHLEMCLELKKAVEPFDCSSCGCVSVSETMAYSPACLCAAQCLGRIYRSRVCDPEQCGAGDDVMTWHGSSPPGLMVQV